MEELWLDIPGYENLYQASNLGNVRTCEGKTTSNARYSRRVWKQRTLKKKLQTNRYGRTDARVSLWKDGKCKDYLISRLVALAWCDGYAPKMTVNHIDGNSMNNAAINLEWIPLGDNIRHAFSNGLYSSQKPVFLEGETETLTFRSQAEASRFLGRDARYINNQLRRGKHNVAGVSGDKYTVVI